MHRDRHRNYAELAVAHREGVDYRVTALCRGNGIVVAAPHGGRIERGTSEVARAIAGEEFDLYLFEGCMPALNFESLHLTSTCFDEARALALIGSAHTVLVVHGVADTGERALLGGRDRALAHDIADRLFVRGVAAALGGHRFPGLDPRNLCNRGRGSAGVQIELSDRLRGGRMQGCVVEAVRAALFAAAAARREA